MGLQHNANVILVAGEPKPRQYFVSGSLLHVVFLDCLYRRC